MDSTFGEAGDLLRWTRAACRAAAGRALQVAVLGDLGCGIWPTTLQQWLDKNFPTRSSGHHRDDDQQPGHHVVPVCTRRNEAGPAALRALTQLRSRISAGLAPHLVVLGFVDDVPMGRADFGRNATALVAPHEQLVRALLQLSRAPAVVYFEPGPRLLPHLSSSAGAALWHGGHDGGHLSVAMHGWAALYYQIPVLLATPQALAASPSLAVDGDNGARLLMRIFAHHWHQLLRSSPPPASRPARASTAADALSIDEDIDATLRGAAAQTADAPAVTRMGVNMSHCRRIATVAAGAWGKLGDRSPGLASTSREWLPMPLHPIDEEDADEEKGWQQERQQERHQERQQAVTCAELRGAATAAAAAAAAAAATESAAAADEAWRRFDDVLPMDTPWNRTGCERALPPGVGGSAASVRALLDAAALGRSRSRVGDVTAWRRAVCRAARGEAVVVAVLGDSITCGHQCAGRKNYADAACAWPARMQRWLRHAFPTAAAAATSTGANAAAATASASASSRDGRRRGRGGGGGGGRRARSPRRAATAAAMAESGADHVVLNLCVPGSTPAMGVERLARLVERRVIGAVDVVIVDYTGNDAKIDHHYRGNATNLLVSNELLIRRVLSLPQPSPPALLYLEAFMSLGYWAFQTGYTPPRPDASADEWRRFDRARPVSVITQAQEWHSILAAHYNLPVLSYRAAVYRRYYDAFRCDRLAPIHRGASASGQGGARGVAVAEASRYFSSSCIHPAWWVHQLYVQIVGFQWWREWQSVRQSAQGSCDAAAAMPSHVPSASPAVVATPPPLFLRQDDVLCESFLSFMSTAPGANGVSGGGGSGGGGGGGGEALQPFTPVGEHDGWRLYSDVVDKPGWICCDRDAAGVAALEGGTGAARHEVAASPRRGGGGGGFRGGGGGGGGSLAAHKVPAITFHVRARAGNVRLSYLRSYAGGMGRALVLVRPARSEATGKPLGQLTAAGTRALKAARRTLASFGRHQRRRGGGSGASRREGAAAAWDDAGAAHVLHGHWEQRVSLPEQFELRGVGRGELAVTVAMLDGDKFKVIEVASC